MSIFFNFVLILAMLATTKSAFAWLCHETASIREGNTIIVCGVAIAVTLEEARLSAFNNARAEFNNICDESYHCKNFEANMEPLRTDCKNIGNNFQCHRGLKYIITNIKKKDLIAKAKINWDKYYQKITDLVLLNSNKNYYQYHLAIAIPFPTGLPIEGTDSAFKSVDIIAMNWNFQKSLGNNFYREYGINLINYSSSYSVKEAEFRTTDYYLELDYFEYYNKLLYRYGYLYFGPSAGIMTADYEITNYYETKASWNSLGFSLGLTVGLSTDPAITGLGAYIDFGLQHNYFLNDKVNTGSTISGVANTQIAIGISWKW